MRGLPQQVVRIALLAAMVLASAWLVPAQVQAPVESPPSLRTTRSIEGTILSESGAPAPGAVVLLKNGKTLEIRSYLADKDGKYRFYGLSSDIDYELRAQANGMTSKTKTVSVFDSHPLIHLNLKLSKKFKA